MKSSKLLIVLLLIASLSACTAINPAISPSKTATADNKTTTSSPYDYTDSILVNGLHRSFIIHLPASHDKSRKWPLVIVLHGGGGEGNGMNALTNFNTLADKQGFIVAYPDGYEHNWNDGRADKNIKAQAENIDDVQFISLLIDYTAGNLGVDTNRIYATGISNGAIMTNRLACELSNKIAAIAPVAGNIPEKTVDVWSPSRPMPVLIINGTEDALVPYNGGDVSFLSLKRGKVISVTDTVKFWVTHNGCPSVPQTSQLPHLNASERTSTTIDRYTGCKDSAEVVLYKVTGGGHTWPGGLQYMSERVIGRTSGDFNATETIWEFFNKHLMSDNR